MQPRRHTPNRKNAASQQQRQTPVQRSYERTALAAEKVSIVCGFLFTLLVRDRTPENIIMTAPKRKSEKTGPNHGKLQLFAEESDRWSVKQGICIVGRPELYSERPIPPYMASFATALIDDCWCWRLLQQRLSTQLCVCCCSSRRAH